MPDVYALLLVDGIDDRETYRRYEEQFDVDSFTAHGGEIVIKSETPAPMEGDWPYQRVVLLRFPSQAQLDAWYGSPEYASVRELRLASARQRMAAFPALEWSEETRLMA
ncbi:DUF1330 domain-containing protein [Baekduia soli]|uniref:DUF1330 domain-containing protein n=1 Tax=Baekduia soli TaxID=496014 RepID=UPI0016526530|nr:DUF1330 domain-containing protein [Baekduia soli]